jgi:DNA-binding PadR family transcriptional regulator
MLRYVLLALLRDRTPRHGYALMKAFAERSGVRLSVGNVYRELQRLRIDGLIAPAANPVGADPRRTPYVITDEGREVLADWFATPASALARGVSDALAYRLALLGEMEPAQVEAFLDDLQAELRAQAKALGGDRTRSPEGGAIAGECPTRAFLESRHARHVAADLALIDDIRRGLAAWRGAARSAGALGGRAAAGIAVPRRGEQQASDRQRAPIAHTAAADRRASPARARHA